MTDTYQTVFDIMSHTERLQPTYLFDALCLVGSAGFLLLPWRQRDSRGKIKWFPLAFGVFCLGMAAFMSINNAYQTFDIRHRIESGDYQTAEGCLVYFHPAFHPGPPHAGRYQPIKEYWAVDRQRFDYIQDDLAIGYNTVEPGGGFVHPDSQVRVAFVPENGINKIVRLEVIQHACPAADDPMR